MNDARAGIVGVLLAAGRGRRFDASGRRNKLLTPAAQGTHAGQPLAVAAARTLRCVLPRVVAVVRPTDDASTRELAEQLGRSGCEVVINDSADDGMGTSLACGVRATLDATGWLVALADMPAIRAETIAAVAAAIERGAETAAPFVDGQRGHPVGFGTSFRGALTALGGDTGARELLAQHPPERIDVDDPGALYDVDRDTDRLTDPPA